MEKCNYQIIKTSSCGRITYCESCGNFHIEFNNLYFTFTPKEYEHFKKFILDLDSEYYVKSNKNNICRKKIIIPFNHPNVMAMFSANDINDFKQLFGQTPKNNCKIESLNLKTFSYSIN